MDQAVVLQDVVKRYGTGSRAVTALDGLSVSVPTGEFVSITGSSGSGKSTMLNVIAGLDTPTAGRVMVAGRDLAEMSDDPRTDLRLRHVGIIFQSFNLFPTFTVEENVLWPLEFQGIGRRDALTRARDALEDVELPIAMARRRPAE